MKIKPGTLMMGEFGPTPYRRTVAPAQPDYTVRKTGDNYGLYFRGSLCESGVFATRATAMKYKAIAENERRARRAEMRLER